MFVLKKLPAYCGNVVTRRHTEALNKDIRASLGGDPGRPPKEDGI